MKRRAELLQLSREHHTALVLAKRAQRLGLGAAADARDFMESLPAIFAEELEPHFQIEEIALLSALRDSSSAKNVSRMVEQTLVEHTALRQLAQEIGAYDFSKLGPFGELLGKHIRFEERELFNLAESLLTPEALARIDEAIKHSGAGCCSTIPS